MSSLTAAHAGTITRPTGTAVALVLAPSLLLAGNLLSSATDEGESAEGLARLAASSGAEQASIICFLLGFTLLLPGVFGLRGMINTRGRTLATVGGWLTAIGAMAFAGLVTSGVATIGMATSMPSDEALRVLTAIGEVPAATVVLLLSLGLPIGVILAAVASRRARLAPMWVPIVVAAGFVVVMVVENTVGGVAGDLLMLAGLGYLGAALLARRPAVKAPQ